MTSDHSCLSANTNGKAACIHGRCARAEPCGKCEGSECGRRHENCSRDKQLGIWGGDWSIVPGCVRSLGGGLTFALVLFTPSGCSQINATVESPHNKQIARVPNAPIRKDEAPKTMVAIPTNHLLAIPRRGLVRGAAAWRRPPHYSACLGLGAPRFPRALASYAPLPTRVAGESAAIAGFEDDDYRARHGALVVHAPTTGELAGYMPRPPPMAPVVKRGIGAGKQFGIYLLMHAIPIGALGWGVGSLNMNVEQNWCIWRMLAMHESL